MEVSVGGIVVDIIECFDDCAVVQEAKTKLVYSVDYGRIDSVCNNSDDDLSSNIISLKGWVEKWQEEKKHKELRTLRRLKRQLKRL